MRISMISVGFLICLTVFLAPRPAKAVEIDVSEFLGTHGCTSLIANVAHDGLDETPERVVLRLEVEHAPGIHGSCYGPSFDSGADLYSYVELIPGLRADAHSKLPAEAGSFTVDLEFTGLLDYFRASEFPLQLWICQHPDFTPVLCSDWYECPETEIAAATLLIDTPVPTIQSTWGLVKALYR